MQFSKLQPEVIKYEVRQLSGVDISKARKTRKGGFARFLSGVGRFLGAIAAPLSFIFPPAAIGAAGAYGLSKIGDMMQVGAAKKQMMQSASDQQDLGQVFIPGLTQAQWDLSSDAGKVFNPMQQNRDIQAANVLWARNDAMMESAHMV